MQYTFFIRFNDLREQGLSKPLISLWYANARQLCNHQQLYVTLENKLPLYLEDIAGYVSDIHRSPGRDFFTVKVETFEEVQDNVITDARELIETMKNGGDYDCWFGKFGKFITLTKVKGRWYKRRYTLKD